MRTPPAAPAVVQPVTLRCLGRDNTSGRLHARFEYETADPWAVWIRFGEQESSIRWGLARHLLAEGLTDPAGDGDVQLWPGTDKEGHSVVVMEFRSPDGRLIAEAPTRDVYRFLTRSLAVVPAGSEADHLDLDALIADLLDTSSAPE
jgi:Streptomyces sporulation and cell division protein, SsgA